MVVARSFVRVIALALRCTLFGTCVEQRDLWSRFRVVLLSCGGMCMQCRPAIMIGVAV